jgi:hypothetical protein
MQPQAVLAAVPRLADDARLVRRRILPAVRLLAGDLLEAEVELRPRRSCRRRRGRRWGGRRCGACGRRRRWRLRWLDIATAPDDTTPTIQTRMRKV